MELPGIGTPALRLLRNARRVGLVFSGGSSRCAFQIGVVEVLLELGVRPAVCVGVSGGSWNAAAVAVGHAHRLRSYWRAFSRMPGVDLRNLLREHSPYRWNELHRRTFGQYVGAENLRRPETLPVFVGVTRLSDGQAVYIDLRSSADPLNVLLASNYLPPFYTHAPRIEGERCGDGGLSNNIPYEEAFAEGCDAAVLVTMKGESEGLPHRNPLEIDHAIPPEYRDRLVVIRPRHPLPIHFLERRWPVLLETIELGRLRADEVLLGEFHPETEARPDAVSTRAARLLLSSWRPLLGPRLRG
ncbi:MAG TPA: patatin-like phospholipase family protein [Thermoanaerobaculia bacterium]|nr:patatin-like phospholipase family protein [Thermoanaerobaculia bacterium]